MQNDDELWLDIIDASSGALLEQVQLAAYYNDFDSIGIKNLWKGYWLQEVALSAGKYRGKTVVISLRSEEHDTIPTGYHIDNASLSYTEWGLFNGP